MNRALIEEALNWRYAVKRYDATKKITEADFKTLKASLLFAPSSYGLQPVKFLVIQNPAVRAELKTAAYGQGQVTDASHFIVILSKNKMTGEDIDRNIGHVAKVRGLAVSALEGLKGMLTQNIVGMPEAKQLGWTQRQAYLAVGFLLETAALLKVDATPMEGIDVVAFDKILKTEGTGWNVAVAVALGYRHPEDSYQALKKVRYDEHDMIEVR